MASRWDNGRFRKTIHDAGRHGVRGLQGGVQVPSWQLPYNPTLQFDFAGGHAKLYGGYRNTEASIKALFSTFSTPSCYVTDSAGNLHLAPANSIHGLYGSDRGQLIEEARTNVIQYSQDQANAAWAKLKFGAALAPVVTANAGIAPDGTLTASRVVFDLNGGTTSSDISDLQCTDFAYTAGKCSGSFWMATTDGSTVTIAALDPDGNQNLFSVNGTLKRYTWLRNVVGSSTSRIIFRLNGGVTSSYASVYLWGAQYEPNAAFASSYIPTTNASATRTKSTISRTIEATYNAASGSAYVEFISAAGSGTQRIWQLDTDANNRISLTRNSSNQIVLDIVDGGVSQASVNLGTLANSTRGKVAINWTAGACAGSLNGAAVVTGTPASIPTVTTERLGSDAAAANQLNGYLGTPSRYQPVLSSDQLVSLAA